MPPSEKSRAMFFFGRDRGMPSTWAGRRGLLLALAKDQETATKAEQEYNSTVGSSKRLADVEATCARKAIRSPSPFAAGRLPRDPARLQRARLAGLCALPPPVRTPPRAARPGAPHRGKSPLLHVPSRLSLFLPRRGGRAPPSGAVCSLRSPTPSAKAPSHGPPGKKVGLAALPTGAANSLRPRGRVGGPYPGRPATSPAPSIAHPGVDGRELLVHEGRRLFLRRHGEEKKS